MMKVLVSGFFERLHTGHLDFLESAAVYGQLCVSIGSDENYFHFKQAYPMEKQNERARLVKAVRCVEAVHLNTAIGELDFEEALEKYQPDIYVINKDGDTSTKRACCARHQVEYRVLDVGQTRQSDLASADPQRLPYRLCLAGGWLDQPFVSKHHSGGVVVVSLNPVTEYMDRAGMATSTRKHARQIWNERIPTGNYESVAKLLFGAENPPGKTEIAGSQDAIGLVYPGLSMPFYEGEYWPGSIVNVVDPDVMQWLNEVLHMVPSYQRQSGYNPLAVQNITTAGVKRLAVSAEMAWAGALSKDLDQFGAGLIGTYRAYQDLFPRTIPEELKKQVSDYHHCPGYNVTGAGGGGYIIVASENAVSAEVPMSVRY